MNKEYKMQKNISLNSTKFSLNTQFIKKTLLVKIYYLGSGH